MKETLVRYKVTDWERDDVKSCNEIEADWSESKEHVVYMIFFIGLISI